jgi:hypothetical protein
MEANGREDARGGGDPSHWKVYETAPDLLAADAERPNRLTA